MATPLNPLFCLNPATFGQLSKANTIIDIYQSPQLTQDQIAQKAAIQAKIDQLMAIVPLIQREINTGGQEGQKGMADATNLNNMLNDYKNQLAAIVPNQGTTFNCYEAAANGNYKYVFDQPDKTHCYVGNDINDVLQENAKQTIYNSNYLTTQCPYAGYYTADKYGGATFDDDVAEVAEWKDVLNIYTQVKGLSPVSGTTYSNILDKERQRLIKTDLNFLNVIGDMQRTIDKQTNELARNMPSHKETLHNKRGENQTLEQRIVFSGLDFWNKSEFSTLLLYGGAGLIVLTIVVYLIKRQTNSRPT